MPEIQVHITLINSLITLIPIKNDDIFQNYGVYTRIRNVIMLSKCNNATGFANYKHR